MRNRSFYLFNVSVNDRPHTPTSIFQHHTRARTCPIAAYWIRVNPLARVYDTAGTYNYYWHYNDTISCAGRRARARTHACTTMLAHRLRLATKRVGWLFLARSRTITCITIFHKHTRHIFCRSIYYNPSGQWFLCDLCILRMFFAVIKWSPRARA